MHADHITGTGRLKQLSGCKSVISRSSGAQADIYVDESDIITFGCHTLTILSTPGHTSGCITYYLEAQVGTALSVGELINLCMPFIHSLGFLLN